jgi:putative DNA primase/helicase
VDEDDLLTDLHLSARFAASDLAGQFCWTAALGWMASRPGKWQRTDDKEVENRAQQWLAAQFREAVAGIGDAEAAARVTKRWLPVLSKTHILAVAELAKRTLRGEVSEFDRHPDLLNCANGVIDLRTGELSPYDPELKLTKNTGVPYLPGAVHPDWAKALEALPEAVHGYLKVRAGQAMTGHMPPDDTILILQGDGENGKTTVVQGLRGAAGDYYVPVSHKVLFGDPGQHDHVFMPFRGARIAVLEETPEEGRINAQQVKRLTTPQMGGHYMHKDEVTWSVSHSLFICTNPLPEVEGTDHATWRRMPMLAFPYTYLKPGTAVKNPERERPGDPGLRQRIIDGRTGQHAAVLAWAVDGARHWYTNRENEAMPPIPEQMRATIGAWRNTANRMFGYGAEFLYQSGSHHVMVTELYKAFNAWLEDSNRRPWSPQRFNERFAAYCRTMRWDVEYRKVRHNAERLSRSRFPETVYMTVPKTYWAWDGVRFRTQDDDDREASDTATDSPDGEANDTAFDPGFDPFSDLGNQPGGS